MVREYTAESIEVLSGLDPVRKRPGMYTETSRPNHLALEVIDNSVDEALAGYATKIEVQLHKDGSLSVVDDGRGMPVDIHPEEGIPGVELIFSRLHAGAKFSNVDYKFSGGLHGVGVSVVNALSTKLSAEIKRGGKKYLIEFKNSEKSKELKETDAVGKIRFTLVISPVSSSLNLFPNLKSMRAPSVNNSLFLNSVALPIAPKFILPANYSAAVAIINLIFFR